MCLTDRNHYKHSKMTIFWVRFNPKRAGGRNPPPSTFFGISQLVVIFSHWNFMTFFLQALRLIKDHFFFKSDRGYDAALRNRALGSTNNWPKTDFQWKLHTNRVFCIFFCFRIHFHYVLSYLFGLFGVRTCVSILWHTSLPKNATFAWKNSEKPWFWQFLVIFVFLTWRHLWRHCGVI